MKFHRISSILRNKLFRLSLLAILLFTCLALLSISGSRVSSQSSTPPRPPQAKNETRRISKLVENAKRSGRDFPTIEPFDRQTRSVTNDATQRRALKAGTVLQLRQNALTDLVNKKSPSLTLRLPVFAGAPVELELVQVNPFAPGFKVVSAANGEPVAFEPGQHYWGVMKGVEDSFAAVSVFKNELIGSFSSAKGGNFVLGKLGGNNPRRDHVLYAESDLTSTIPVQCNMPANNANALEALEVGSSSNSVTRCIKIYIEVAWWLYLNKGSVQETVNFVTGFFNQSAALYINEGIPISISEIAIWTSPDPFFGHNAEQQLQYFQIFRTSFNGDFAQLIDLHQFGGVADRINGFCNPNASARQSYSGIDPFYQNVPAYSWTVNVFTHELGHLFGSPHTHACVWNGNGSPIDGCGPAAGYFDGCVVFPPLPPEGGTIMSYCHLLPQVGINFANGFGPQPGNVIRAQFNSATCLGTCGNPGNGNYTTAFQTVGGFFLSAEWGGGGILHAIPELVGDFETFTLIDLNGGALESGDLVNIQTYGNYFVVAEGGGGGVVNANRTVPLSWETFRIDKIWGGGGIGSGDAVSLQASNGWSGGGGNYVVAESGGGNWVNANRGAVGPWETFTIYIW